MGGLWSLSRLPTYVGQGTCSKQVWTFLDPQMFVNRIVTFLSILVSLTIVLCTLGPHPVTVTVKDNGDFVRLLL